MKIIARNENGFILEANNAEILTIIEALTNQKIPNAKDIPIGYTIPGINYAETIKAIKGYKDSYYAKQLIAASIKIQQEVAKFEEVLNISSTPINPSNS